MPALNDLYRRYGDRVAFYVVYIQEAHPVDSWQTGSNVRDHVLVNSTKTLEQRSDVAGTCLLRLSIKLPAVIDKPDDAVERAYTGWPDRLYVVDTNGRVAYKSAAGPFGFRPEEVEAVLRRISPVQHARRFLMNGVSRNAHDASVLLSWLELKACAPVVGAGSWPARRAKSNGLQ